MSTTASWDSWCLWGKWGRVPACAGACRRLIAQPPITAPTPAEGSRTLSKSAGNLPAIETSQTEAEADADSRRGGWDVFNCMSLSGQGERDYLLCYSCVRHSFNYRLCSALCSQSAQEFPRCASLPLSAYLIPATWLQTPVADVSDARPDHLRLGHLSQAQRAAPTKQPGLDGQTQGSQSSHSCISLTTAFMHNPTPGH